VSDDDSPSAEAGTADDSDDDNGSDDDSDDDSAEAGADDGDNEEEAGTPSDQVDGGGMPPAGGDAEAPAGDGGDLGPEEPVIAEWPEDGVTLIDLDDDGHAELSSTQTDAPELDDLDWAKLPGVACWEDNNISDEFFSAEHTAFALAEVVPAWSEVTITITPAGNNEANVYVIE